MLWFAPISIFHFSFDCEEKAPFGGNTIDLTSAASFDKVKYWVREVQNQEPTCELILCGTKLDLLSEGVTRAVPQEAVEEFASKTGMKAFETSSKTGENVEFLFRAVAEGIEGPLHETRGTPPLPPLLSPLSFSCY